MTKGKTKEFKEKQCGHCKLADQRAYRKGWPCCPLPNPKIRNGHCVERKPMERGTRFDPDANE